MRIKIINGLKIGLPLLGLGILATLFMNPSPINTDNAIPLAQVDMVDLVAKPRMKILNYNSVTANGSLINILAEELEQKADASGDVIAQVVRGTVVTPAGLTLKFKSDTSDLNQAESILTLTGNAHIDTSTQYHLTSDQFISYFKESFLISQTPVVAWGPLGRVTGDIMELRQESANDENRPQDYILKFKNNVKVLYTPDGLAESGALEDAAQLRSVEELDER